MATLKATVESFLASITGRVPPRQTIETTAIPESTRTAPRIDEAPRGGGSELETPRRTGGGGGGGFSSPIIRTTTPGTEPTRETQQEPIIIPITPGLTRQQRIDILRRRTTEQRLTGSQLRLREEQKRSRRKFAPIQKTRAVRRRVARRLPSISLAQALRVPSELTEPPLFFPRKKKKRKKKSKGRKKK